MKWTVAIASPKHGDSRERRVFAWRPTRMSPDERGKVVSVWLETYQITEHFGLHGWSQTSREALYVIF